MTILSHVLAVIFGLGFAWWLDHFVFPAVGRLIDAFLRERNGGAS